MGMPYRARVNERTLLNLPGFYDAASIHVYVEDTSERGLFAQPGCDDDPANFEPRLIVEIADRYVSLELDFDVDTTEGRVNSLHKLDTLVAAFRVFREALVAEFAEYDRRERELEASQH